MMDIYLSQSLEGRWIESDYQTLPDLRGNGAIGHRSQDILNGSPKQEDTQGVAVQQATEGMIAFRQGRIMAGRDEYRRATETLQQLGHRELGAMTAIYWAVEETLARTPMSSEVTRLAQSMANRVNSAEVNSLLPRLEAVPST
jgi:hypothetical protein